jgi:hypothetical protein
VERRRTLLNAVVDTNVIACLLLGTEQYCRRGTQLPVGGRRGAGPGCLGSGTRQCAVDGNATKGSDNSGCDQPADSGWQPGEFIPFRTELLGWVRSCERTHRVSPLMTRSSSSLLPERGCPWQPLTQACSKRSPTLRRDPPYWSLDFSRVYP